MYVKVKKEFFHIHSTIAKVNQIMETGGELDANLNALFSSQSFIGIKKCLNTYVFIKSNYCNQLRAELYKEGVYREKTPAKFDEKYKQQLPFSINNQFEELNQLIQENFKILLQKKEF